MQKILETEAVKTWDYLLSIGCITQEEHQLAMTNSTREPLLHKVIHALVSAYPASTVLPSRIEQECVSSQEPTLEPSQETLPDQDTAEPDLMDGLTDCQVEAFRRITTWLDKPYDKQDNTFVLRGFAGTGKTYLMDRVKTRFQGFVRFLWTAPTNKATKVLGDAVGESSVTTYSALGLRMDIVDGELELCEGTTPYIPAGTVLVIDEAGMASSLLVDKVQDVVQKLRLRVIFMGDPAQLNPVKESKSKVWKLAVPDTSCAFLAEVRRHSNDILVVATNLRNSLKRKEKMAITTSGEGVQVVSENKFVKDIRHYAKQGKPFKVLAWRNRTVTRYNNIVREALGYTEDYNAGESIVFTQPYIIKDVIEATTDEEVVVSSVLDTVRVVHMPDGSTEDIPVYAVSVHDKTYIVHIPKPEATHMYAAALNHWATYAKKCRGSDRRLAWRAFFEIKSSFASVVYGSSLTVHRAQGSTYQTVFIDQEDILANKNIVESMRCLYTAATRAQNRLITY